jgi:uncharacterized membrane protein
VPDKFWAMCFLTLALSLLSYFTPHKHIVSKNVQPKYGLLQTSIFSAIHNEFFLCTFLAVGWNTGGWVGGGSFKHPGTQSNPTLGYGLAPPGGDFPAPFNERF